MENAPNGRSLELEVSDFGPIACYGGRMHREEITRLRRASIRFRHPKTRAVLKERVVLRRCGSSLKEALRA